MQCCGSVEKSHSRRLKWKQNRTCEFCSCSWYSLPCVSPLHPPGSTARWVIIYINIQIATLVLQHPTCITRLCRGTQTSHPLCLYLLCFKSSPRVVGVSLLALLPEQCKWWIQSTITQLSPPEKSHTFLWIMGAFWWVSLNEMGHSWLSNLWRLLFKHQQLIASSGSGSLWISLWKLMHSLVLGWGTRWQQSSLSLDTGGRVCTTLH